MPQQVRYQLWIVAAAIVIFFTNLGGAALWDMDEALYSTCAREMLQRGNWVVPWFNGEMFPEKPPLMFWTMMAGYELFGMNEFAARFFSAVFGVATALAAFHLGRILFNSRVGLWAGLITASTIIFTVSARAATVDSALTLLTTTAFLFFAMGLKDSRSAGHCGATEKGSGFSSLLKKGTGSEPTSENLAKNNGCEVPVPLFQQAVRGKRAGAANNEGRDLQVPSPESRAPSPEPRTLNPEPSVCRPSVFKYRYVVPMYVCIGAAVLGKGPVGMLLPLATMGLYLGVADGWRNLLRSAWWMRPLTAIVVVSAVALPWYVWVGVCTDGEWLRRFFVEFNLRPFKQPIQSHGDTSYLTSTLAILVSLLYYFYQVPAILVGFFPWSVFLGPTLLQRRGQTFNINFRAQSDYLKSAPGSTLAMCWFGTWFVFWSMCKTKLPHYLLPAYPALALLTACFVERWQTEPASLRRWWLRNAWGSMILVGVAMLIALPILAKILLPGEAILGLLGLIPMIGGAWCWRQTARGRHPQAVITFAVTAVVFLTAIFGWAVPRVDRFQNTRPILATIAADSGQTTCPAVAAYRFFRESMVHYAGHPVTRCEDEKGQSAQDRLRNFLTNSKPLYVVTLTEHLPEIEQAFPGQFDEIFRQRLLGETESGRKIVVLRAIDRQINNATRATNGSPVLRGKS